VGCVTGTGDAANVALWRGEVIRLSSFRAFAEQWHLMSGAVWARQSYQCNVSHAL
jgi:hypothetical protein